MKSRNGKIRILLLHNGVLSGHKQASKAIRQALNKLYPEIKVRERNIFRYGHLCWRCLLDSLYQALIKLVPWLWDFIWDSKEVYYLTYILRSFLYRINYFQLYKEVILPFNPQAVICTFNIPCALCSVIKEKKGVNYLLAAVPTDFYLHPYWFYKNVDVYFLPHEGLKKELIRKKVDPDKIQITGIPISLDFSRSTKVKKLKNKWGLKENLFTILLIGGGQGMGSLMKIVLTLNNLQLPIQLLVVTGTNRRLKRKFQKMQPNLSFPLKVLGYTRHISELMEVSDLLISKPGGLTVAEALTKELPLGIVDSLAGQERRNRELLLKKGIAFELKDKESIIDLIYKFSNDSFDLKSWRKRVKDLARPEAARVVAQKIMYLIEERVTLARIAEVKGER